jgi:hypothetical protein
MISQLIVLLEGQLAESEAFSLKLKSTISLLKSLAPGLKGDN